MSILGNNYICKLIPWSKVLLEKPTVVWIVKKFPHFIKPKYTLPCPQQPATCVHPKPQQPSSCLPNNFFKIHFNIILPSMPWSSKWSLSFRFLHQNPLLFPIHTTCPTHLIHLDLITRIVFGEQYNSWSPSLCTLLQSCVTSSLVDPNIFLSTVVSNTFSICSSLNVRHHIIGEWYIALTLETPRRSIWPVLTFDSLFFWIRVLF